MRLALGGLALLAALAAAACRTAETTPGGPRLIVRWTGADTAEFSARPVAEWCDSLRLLEIRAMAGDTGVGLAVYPPDGIEPGAYPIRRPDVAAKRPPSAAVALRWFSRTAVQGFQGDSGELTLERGRDGKLSGRFTAAAHPVLGQGRLRLTGSFDAVQPVPGTRSCIGPAPGDTTRVDSTAADSAAGDTTVGVD